MSTFENTKQLGTILPQLPFKTVIYHYQTDHQMRLSCNKERFYQQFRQTLRNKTHNRAILFPSVFAILFR